jgi:hypothetical protein
MPVDEIIKLSTHEDYYKPLIIEGGLKPMPDLSR